MKKYDVSKRKAEWKPTIMSRIVNSTSNVFMITGTMYFVVRVIEIYFHW